MKHLWCAAVVCCGINVLGVGCPLLGADASGEKPYGIAARVPWTTSRVTGSPEPPSPFRTERLWPKLTFTEPVELVTMPGTDRLAVLERLGQVYLIRDDHTSSRRDLVFNLARLPDFVQAFGIVFHPDFADNRHVYVCYSRSEGEGEGVRVSRFTVSTRPAYRFDPVSEKKLIQWHAVGHRGGCLRFGPDGYLYVSVGDGSTPSPPDANDSGQDIGDFLASILRIDVDHPQGEQPYAVPEDNPFVEMDGARPEVWSYGFRNPWKMSFDTITGDLWVGDVGWEMWEMVYRVEPGGNYGWSLVEGPQSVRPEATPGPTPVIEPVVSHSHTESRSVTGGFVYQGSRLPKLVGRYIYGDFVTGKIWALHMQDGELASVEELVDATAPIIAFATDQNNELLVVGYDGGIHEIVANDNISANHDFPQRLSDTGLFESVPRQTPAPGVIPYSINVEQWEDGARAERWLAVPGAAKLSVHTEQDISLGIIKGEWAYPSDTVFAKTLSLPIAEEGRVDWRPVETQLLHRDGDIWRAYAYVWTADGTDATLVSAEGSSLRYQIADPHEPSDVQQQAWRIVGRTECLICHTTGAGSIHGFHPPQLDRLHDDETVTENQLRNLAHIGLIDPPQQPVEPMPSLWDERADLEERGRAYLHVNCSHCHLPGGGGTANFDLRYDQPLSEMRLVDERPSQGTFRIPFAKVVAPANPYHSVLLYRMAKLGRGRMPHAGSSVVDQRGLQLIRRWIQQLPSPDSLSPEGRSALHSLLEDEQLAAMAELGSDKGAVESALDRLLDSTSGALRLVFAIDDGQLAEPALARTIERGVAHPQPEIRDLFERFLPEEKRPKRLGNFVRVAELLSAPGDAQRGKELFFNTQGVQCKSCHKIDQTGIDLGPDLSAAARKSNRAQLLESILDPSKKIDPKFVPYLVETAQGRVFTGLLVSRSGKEVVLRDAQNKLVNIAVEDVEVFTPQQKSLMPELLLRDLNEQQVADLLEFLESLK